MNTSTTRQRVPSGTIFEYRIARLRYCQGYFVRRSIDLWPSIHEGQQLAEIDCISISFDPQMRRTFEVVECKTGSRGQGEIDRLLWLKGMAEYVKAGYVTFAKLSIAPRTRDFARQIGVDVLDEKAINTIERSLRISNTWWPSYHNPDFGEQIVKPARGALAGSNELRRAGKYLFGSFWFTDDFTRIKQLRSLFRLLVENSTKIPQNALKLGIGEAVTLFTLTTLSIASWQNQLTEVDFQQLLTQELSTGLGDPQSLRNLLRRIDDINREQFEAIHKSYQELGAGRVPFRIRSLESEVLIPPEWIEGYIELISRFSRRPNLATSILQWIDLWSAIMLGYKSSQPDYDHFAQQEHALNNALELVLAFLNRMWGVPTEFFEKNKYSKPISESSGNIKDINQEKEGEKETKQSDSLTQTSPETKNET